MNKSLLCFLLVSILSLNEFSSFVSAQDANQQSWRQNFAEEKSLEWQLERSRVLEFVERTGIPLRQQLEDGRIIELQRIENGFPVYYETFNRNAAEFSSVDQLWPGGETGLSLSGSSETLGIWDGGAVRITHDEFGGRVTQRDGADTDNPNNHATHVAGTMVAAGVESAAHGMAFEADLDAYDWSDDLSEVASAANDGVRVSNHSYGQIRGWHCPGSTSACNDDTNGTKWQWYGTPSISETEDFRYGFYTETSRDWDQLANNASQNLIVKAAGNSRLQGPSSQPIEHEVWDPSEEDWVVSNEERDLDGGPDGFNSLGGLAVSKNLLVVGAVMGSGAIASFSSRGPTDDGRIKPELVARGTGVTSPVASSDSDYASFNGTSMATPVVSGTIALLQQHYQDLHGGSMPLASTIRALLIHTADQAGSGEGPDYTYGWGILNAQKAAELLSEDDESDDEMVQELTLNDGEELEIEISSDGIDPLRATISWTDPAGTPPSAQLNPVDIMLVNDLDLRITGPDDTEYQPYILDPDNPGANATTGDNEVDNNEQVYIDEPQSGTYTVSISHKGSLDGGSQTFSLIMEGMADEAENPPDQVVLTEPENEAEQVDQQPTLSWNHADGAETYELQLDTDSNFSSPQIDETGLTDTSFDVDFGLEENTSYHWRVRAVNQAGNGDWSDSFSFTTVTGPPDQVVLSSPEDEAENVTLQPEFIWEDTEAANTYTLQLDIQDNFSDPVIDETGISSTSYFTEDDLDNATTYFWRVQAHNPQGDGDWSDVYSFTTLPEVPEQVVLSEPENQQEDVSVNPELSWQEADRAETYEVVVDESSDFTDPVVEHPDLDELQYHLTDSLDNERTYYWRVRAANVGGEGSWSDTYSFTTIPALPEVVTLLSPEHEQNRVELQPELVWDSSQGSDNYQLQVSKNSDFDELEIDLSDLEETTHHFEEELERVQTYYWRVRGSNRVGQGEWSEIFSFQTKATTPAKVVLNEPEDEADDVSVNPLLQWEEAEGALNYNLRLADNDEFDNPELDVTEIEETELEINSELEDNTNYYWKVSASNPAGKGEWSDTRSFRTEVVTSVEEETELPEDVILKQNNPNPFNPVTNIEFILPERSEVKLQIYDTVGREVEVLVDGSLDAGHHQVTFRPQNLTSGVYIYRLQAGNVVRTRTLTYLK